MVKAYTPIKGAANVSQTENVAKPDVPNYPDKGGIAFANYYKVQLPQGGYQLLTQERVNLTINAPAGASGEYIEQLIAADKTMYITDIQITFTDECSAAVVQWYIFRDTTSPADIPFFGCLPRSTSSPHVLNYHFDVPFPFKNLLAVGRDADALIGAICWTFSGWLE